MKKGGRFNPYRLFNGVNIPEAVCRIPTSKLSHGAKMAYGRLLRYAGKNGYAFPRRETIADEIGVSWRSIDDYIKELTKFGLIERDRRGKKRSNIYFFIWHDIFDQKQSEFKVEEPYQKNPSELQDTVSHSGGELQDTVTPYEESHVLRESLANAYGIRNLKSNGRKSSLSGMEYTPVDEDGRPTPPRRVGSATDKESPAFKALVEAFQSMCIKKDYPKPLLEVWMRKKVRKNLKDSGLDHKKAIELLEDWFSGDRKDVDMINITYAFGAQNINNYKVRNGIK